MKRLVKWLFGTRKQQLDIPVVSGSLHKLPPKEWFEYVFIGKEVCWGTNMFSDIAAIQLIEKYIEYTEQ